MCNVAYDEIARLVRALEATHMIAIENQIELQKARKEIDRLKRIIREFRNSTKDLESE
jgi:hypothetical protein